MIGGTSAAWTDVLTTGVAITETVAGLEPNTAYHWRARLAYYPGNRLGQSASRWLYGPAHGMHETDFRTAATTVRTITYAYDPLGRLTDADYSTGESFEYAYDQVGNRTVYTVTLESTMVTTYTYDAANRLTNAGGVAYTWDARGNLTHDGVFTYTYNAAGRLVLAESVTSTLVYTYTTGGLRVGQGKLSSGPAGEGVRRQSGGGEAGIEGDAIGDQGGKVRRGEADAQRRPAVVLDVGGFVQVMGKRARQIGILGMRLRVVPANRLPIPENCVAIIEQFTI